MGRRNQKVKKVKTGANQSFDEDTINGDTIVTQDNVVTRQSSNGRIVLEDTIDATINEVIRQSDTANVSVESGYSSCHNSTMNSTMEASSDNSAMEPCISDIEYVLSLITNPRKRKSQHGHPFKTREKMAVVPPGITSFEYKHFINYIPPPCAESREWTNLLQCRGCATLLPFNTASSILPSNTSLPHPDPCLTDQPIGLGGDYKVIGPSGDYKTILPAPLFFNHCVYSCERYKSLGLIKKCNDCRSLFLDEMLLNQHKDNCYLIAEENGNWKGYKTILSYERREDLESKNAISKHFSQGIIGSDQLVKEGIINESSLIKNSPLINESPLIKNSPLIKDSSLIKNSPLIKDSPLITKPIKDIAIVSVPQVDPLDALSPSVILCPGCHSPFKRDPVKLDNKWFMNLQYLNHCVFKCPKYHDQIFCTKCDCFFLNDDHYSDGSIHGCKSIKSGRESIKSDLKLRSIEKGAGSSKQKQISESNENGEENGVKNQRNTGSKSWRKLGEFPESVSMILDTRSCAQCDIWFVSPKELQHHFQKFHPSSLMFHCSLCPKTFKRHDHVKDHLTKIHSIAGNLVYTKCN